MLVRNSFAIIPASIAEKSQHFEFSWINFLTKNVDELTTLFVLQSNSEVLDFETEHGKMDEIFQSLRTKATLFDPQLLVQMDLEHKNAKDNLNKIEAKFIKSSKQKSDSAIKNLQRVKSALFPDNFLQERFINGIACFGSERSALEQLIDFANPLESAFKVIKI